MRSLTAGAVLVSAAALAQTDPAPSTALPSAPSSAASPAPALGTSATGSKLGTINVENAIFGSNEGQRDLEALSKKLEPKRNDLKAQNDAIDALKKQLSTQGASMNEDAKGNLTRQIEQKQKALERAAQDAQEDFQNQQQEIGSRIFQKMGPIILKYATDNALGVIIDTSNPWPNGPVLWAGPSVDITKPVVEAYNTQSGVPAPVRPAGSGAAGSGTSTRPSGVGTTRPSAPATKPPTTQAPPK
jgi:outer membrane protein